MFLFIVILVLNLTCRCFRERNVLQICFTLSQPRMSCRAYSINSSLDIRDFEAVTVSILLFIRNCDHHHSLADWVHVLRQTSVAIMLQSTLEHDHRSLCRREKKKTHCVEKIVEGDRR